MKSPARTAGEYGPRGVGAVAGKIRSIIVTDPFSFAAAGATRPFPPSELACARALSSAWAEADSARRSSAVPPRKAAAHPLRPLRLPARVPARAVRQADKTPRRATTA